MFPIFLVVSCKSLTLIFILNTRIDYFKPAQMWELTWLLSGITAYIGYGSLPKNGGKQMLAYIVGNIIFGLIPLVYGASIIIQDSLHQYRNKVSFSEWQDAPMKLAVISVCLQVQIMGTFYGMRLFRAWTSGSKKSD